MYFGFDFWNAQSFDSPVGAVSCFSCSSAAECVMLSTRNGSNRLPFDFACPRSQHLYNGTFGRMDVLEILNEDLSLNEKRYAEVGPLQLTPYFALTYGVSFALLTSALSTILLWHVGDIRKAIAASFNQTGDVHVEREAFPLVVLSASQTYTPQ